MARGGHVPHAIVLALGAGALGGPEALRLLLQFAGQSGPAFDLTICFVVIALLTVPVLGTVLLVRFVRKPSPAPARSGRGRGGRTPATATDVFAHVTAAVSVGAALLVTASLLAVPAGQIRGLPIDFAVVNVNLTVAAVLVVCAAIVAAATGSLPGAAHLWARLFRGAGAGSVGGGRAAPAAAAPAPATAARINKAAVFVVTTSLVGVAQLLFPEFHWWRRMVTAPVAVGVAVVMVAGTAVLVVRCCYSRRGRARNAAAAAARTS